MLAFVVAKNVRAGERIAFGLALRSGLDMAGAEAPLLSLSSFGTTEVVPFHKAFRSGPAVYAFDVASIGAAANT